jgi:LPS sulfotransferase NodH
MSADASQDHGVLDKQFLFIVGSPRSGTSWLQLMLGAHPSVCTSTELRLFNGYVAPWLEAWRVDTQWAEEGRSFVGLPVVWKEDEFHAFLKSFLERVYSSALEEKPSASHILDKHPAYSDYVSEIRLLIPQARFIHVIRDGRDVAVSLYEASRQLGWFDRHPLHGYAATWRRRVLGAKQAEEFGDDYLEIRYEDLSASPQAELARVFRHCGLEASDDLVEQIVEAHAIDKMRRSRSTAAAGVRVPEGHYRQGRVGTWHEKFTPPQRYLFEQAAGDLLEELGYARNGWWAEGRLQRLWVPVAAAGPSLYRMLRVRRLGHAAAVLLGRRVAVRPQEAQR